MGTLCIRASYDGDGERVEKTNGTAGTLYWPDLYGSAAEETDLSGGSLVRNIFVGGTQIAREDSSGNWSYFLHDQLGTPRMALSSSGVVTSDVDYYPFGGVAYSAGSTSNLYGFTGYENDSESSSNYAVFRNQSPTLGRFLRPDPYDGSYDQTNSQSLNRYVYALNNPLAFIDPSGLQCVWSDGSYDAADDPTTGNAQGCATAGGTYVDPSVGAGIGLSLDGNLSPDQWIADFAVIQATATTGPGGTGSVWVQGGANSSGGASLTNIAPSKPTTPTPVCYQGGCIIPGGPAPLPSCKSLGAFGTTLKNLAAGTAVYRAAALWIFGSGGGLTPEVLTGLAGVAGAGQLINSAAANGIGCTP